MGRLSISFDALLFVACLYCMVGVYSEMTIEYKRKYRGMGHSVIFKKGSMTYQSKVNKYESFPEPRYDDGNGSDPYLNTDGSASSTSFIEIGSSHTSESLPDLTHIEEVDEKAEHIHVHRQKRADEKTWGWRVGSRPHLSRVVEIHDQVVQAVVDRYDSCYTEGYVDSCENPHLCLCDQDCVVYGDCCLDASRQPNRTQDDVLQSIVKRLECVEVYTGMFYRLVTSCAPGSENTSLEEACINVNKTNILSATPVYDKDFKISFRNIHCAKCNAVRYGNQQFWKMRLRRCEFMRYNEMDVLTDFINQLLNEPNTSCTLFVDPRSDFRQVRCFESYAEGYVCDGYDLSQNTEVNTQSTARFPVSVTNATIFPSTISNDNIQPQASSETFLSPNSRLINVTSIKEVCLTYKNVVAYRMYGRMQIFRNSVCMWCKQDSFDKRGKKCMARIPTGGKVISHSILINFHSALETLWAQPDEHCKENEVMESINNVCRRLTCTSRRIASYGKCIDAYSLVTTPRFSFVVYTPCEDVSKFFLETVKRYLGKIIKGSFKVFTPSMSYQNQERFYIHTSRQSYCNKLCVMLGIVEETSRHEVMELTSLFKNVFALNIMDGESSLTRLDIRNDLTSCSSPFQTEQDSVMSCPYLTFNIGELTILENHLHTISMGFNKNSFLKVNDTYLICYHIYKQLLKSIADIPSRYLEKHQFEKSIVSLTLISVSLLALIISSLIYVTHPDLRTIPCRMSLNTMLALIVTCVLFILANIFDSNSDICFVVAILTQYAWLCVFVWSVLFGYHTVTVFSKLHVVARANCNARKQRVSVRLVLYGVIAYITPLVATACTVVLDRTGTFIMGYGVPTCFVTNKNALLLTFGLPVTVMILLNCVSLIIVTVKMYRFAPGSSVSEDMKTSVFKTFVKLAACLGLTWIFGIAAAVTNVEVLWYIHIVMNSSHGITLFVVLILWGQVVTSWCRKKLGFIKCRSSETPSGGDEETSF